MNKHKISISIVVFMLLFQMLGGFWPQTTASAQLELTPKLGEAEAFGLLAAKGIDSQSPSQIEQNLGVGSAEFIFDETNFVVKGTIHLGDELVATALEDAMVYRDFLAPSECEVTLNSDSFLQNELVLSPGRYCLEAVTELGNKLLLAATTEDEKFTFHVAGPLLVKSSFEVETLNPEAEVNWLVEELHIEPDVKFVGTVLSVGDIKLAQDVQIGGRLISLDGGISLDGSVVSEFLLDEEEPEPIELPIEPVDEVPEPEEITPEPIEETPEPVDEIPEPEEITPEPIEETPELVDEVPEPEEITPDPIEETPEPVDEVPEPEEITPEPIEETPVEETDGEDVDASILGMEIEKISPYYEIGRQTLEDGTILYAHHINGPSTPPENYAIEAEDNHVEGISYTFLLPYFPSYDWVFGCSAVSAAMVSAYYDYNGLPNMYAGPSNKGNAPITDTHWGTWTDGAGATYPGNPIVASRKGTDRRTTRGSVDDYWVESLHPGPDPFITGNWAQHAYGTAVGDYMRTSQSRYDNRDGWTWWHWPDGFGVYTCEQIENAGIHYDGAVGVKQFFNARGYGVGNCYSTGVDTNGGTYTLYDFQSSIFAGRPVIIHLEGHTVVGYGYERNTDWIYIRDTWDSDPTNLKYMRWGESYLGLKMLAVSVIEPIVPTTKLPTPVSPASKIYSYNPMYIWKRVNGATMYDVTVKTRSGEVVIHSEYFSSEICGFTNCAVRQGPLPYYTNYIWEVDAYSYGEWTGSSASKAFTPVNPVPVTKAPSGPTFTRTPDFTWVAIPGASHYQVQVFEGGTLLGYLTVRAMDVCSGTLCKTTVVSGLAPGNYFWRVKSYMSGWRSFSRGKPFVVTNAPKPIAPIGTVSTGSPKHQWVMKPGAAYYAVHLFQGSKLLAQKTVYPSACSGNICSATIKTNLPNGKYFWRVRAYAYKNWTDWSPYAHFTVSR